MVDGLCDEELGNYFWNYFQRVCTTFLWRSAQRLDSIFENLLLNQFNIKLSAVSIQLSAGECEAMD
jgi:hypothetical protein